MEVINEEVELKIDENSKKFWIKFLEDNGFRSIKDTKDFHQDGKYACYDVWAEKDGQKHMFELKRRFDKLVQDTQFKDSCLEKDKYAKIMNESVTNGARPWYITFYSDNWTISYLNDSLILPPSPDRRESFWCRKQTCFKGNDEWVLKHVWYFGWNSIRNYPEGFDADVELPKINSQYETKTHKKLREKTELNNINTTFTI